jgi:hypothetical protein
LALDRGGPDCDRIMMIEFEKPERINPESPDQRQELLHRLMDAAPEAFAEGKLDLDTLKTLLGDAVETGPERFTFTWARSSTVKPEPCTGAKDGSFWRAIDIDKCESFTISLDEAMTLEALLAFDLMEEGLFFCRAAILPDTLAANLALQCRLKMH